MVKNLNSIILLIAVIGPVSALAQICPATTNVISSTETSSCAPISNSLTQITSTGIVMPAAGEAIFVLDTHSNVIVENAGLLSTSSGSIANTILNQGHGVGITNTQTISNVYGYDAIQNYENSGAAIRGSFDYITNSAAINAVSGGSGIANFGDITNINNSGGTISAVSGGAGVINMGNITNINNNSGGAISSDSGSAINNQASGVITNINNGGDISGYNSGIENHGSIVNIYIQGTGLITQSRLSPSSAAINNQPSATIGLIDNSGAIVGQAAGILNNSDGTINSITNNGNIISNTVDSSAFTGFAIDNQPASLSSTEIGAISNTGYIQANGGSAVAGTLAGINNSSSIGSIDNSGYIRAISGSVGDVAFGIQNNAFATIGTITNSGTISATSGGLNYATGISNLGTILNITNTAAGVIGGTPATGAGDAFGIQNSGSITGTLINAGTISAAGSLTTTSAGIDNSGFINELINTGTVLGGAYGIINTGTINTLSNAQGNLTYQGNLPTNYNIIITSASNYGKLAVTGAGITTTTFGIYTGSTVRNGTYTSVLSGLNLANLTRTSGTFGSGSWTLNNSSADIWDLILSGFIDPVILNGPSVANTNQSLVNTASVLQGTYTLQNSVLANSLSYDCTVFGANNVCVSAGGRNTAVAAANGLNNTSALLIAAYRPHPNYRIGAYADQNLSVSNLGGTVNLGNNTPLIGLFGAWTQKFDGTGAEVKVSAAYGQKNTTITRSVVGSGDGASEAGSGSSTLNSQGVQATAKYGFGIAENVIISPYVGVRYTQNNMGGYTEGASSSVTAPLTYSALNTNATTALAGVGASYRVIPTVTTFASAGVETDTNTANGTYSATNASIGTLTPVNFNANPVRTRPTATLGAYYDVAKNQRLGVTGIYRQEPYQAVSTTTVMATYTIGL